MTSKYKPQNEVMWNFNLLSFRAPFVHLRLDANERFATFGSQKMLRTSGSQCVFPGERAVYNSRLPGDVANERFATLVSSEMCERAVRNIRFPEDVANERFAVIVPLSEDVANEWFATLVSQKISTAK
jgi:hypothetical protein